MLILGLGLKAKFLGFGLGLECSGLGIRHKLQGDPLLFKICYVNNAILNCEGELNSNISVAKYLSYWLITYCSFSRE